MLIWEDNKAAIMIAENESSSAVTVGVNTSTCVSDLLLRQVEMSKCAYAIALRHSNVLTV